MNDDLAIKITNVSKQYGHLKSGRNHGSLKEELSNKLRLTKKFDDQSTSGFYALKNINLDIKKGEVIGIVGKNGSGKSTMLKLISKVITPTTGTIETNGKISSLIEVGAGFHAQLTGRENVYFNGAILGMKKKEIDDKIEEIFKFSGIGKFFDTPVKHYSSGMYVRLAFSVAIHVDPEILIVDEVLSVGDFEFRKKCEDKINSLMKSNKTILMVSHSTSTIENMCSRAILLEKGHLKMDDSPEKVVKKYLGEE